MQIGQTIVNVGPITNFSASYGGNQEDYHTNNAMNIAVQQFQPLQIHSQNREHRSSMQPQAQAGDMNLSSVPSPIQEHNASSGTSSELGNTFFKKIDDLPDSGRSAGHLPNKTIERRNFSRNVINTRPSVHCRSICRQNTALPLKGEQFPQNHRKTVDINLVIIILIYSQLESFYAEQLRIHPSEVANAADARHCHTKKTHCTDVQCKNRVDTLKKKFKIEKAKIAESSGTTSSWPFFSHLDVLIGSSFNKQQQKFMPSSIPLASQSTSSLSLLSPPMAVPLPFTKFLSAMFPTSVFISVTATINCG
ncbi:unnamed protein product [Fraxinus pennsylvanica]|uniref:Myb/SANT-like DNA-binding domain-containing protein n=1 Tax=Fraxinus pennsylvanica TaxID=56036 RepID=A0AAD2AL00_9LAMI|nr:unnamed protein product [Fraxinus pennsylvanica]